MWHQKTVEITKERLGMTVVKCTIAGSYLVGPDQSEPLPAGKTWSNIAVPVYHYKGRDNRGWWSCDRCGSVVDTTRQECDHVKLAMREERKDESLRS